MDGGTQRGYSAHMRKVLLHIALVTLPLWAGACAGGMRQESPPVLRLYLARHGQTDWNLERRLQGWTDTHLNDTGRQQAQALAQSMQGVPLVHVYSSSLSRSRETAEVARATAPLTSLEGLREQHIGKFEGLRMNTDSLGAREFQRRSQDPEDGLDGGESENQFFARVSQAIREIAARHAAGGNILVVGHGGTNQMVLRALMGLTRDQAEAVKQANDELYLIEIAPGEPPRLWKAIGAGNLADL